MIFVCMDGSHHHITTSSNHHPSYFHSKLLYTFLPEIGYLGEIFHPAHHQLLQDFQGKIQGVNEENASLKLWHHQCDYEILTHSINFFGDNLFLFKLTLVETKFFSEQISTEYPCSTSENLKLSQQNSVLISEKFALVETTHVFRINTEGAVGVIV